MTDVGATKAEKVYEPKDPAGLSRLLVILLWIDLVVGLFNGVATFAELQLVSAMPGDTPTSFSEGPPLPVAVTLIRSFVSLTALASYVVTGFVCLKWIYRMSLNAHALTKGLTITPGWAIGWYFVPIASLFKPFQALKEAWQASAQPTAWRSVDTPGILRLWWGLWLASGILSNISFRVSMSAKTTDMLVLSDGLDLVIAIVGVPLNLVFIRIVEQMKTFQASTLSQRVFS